MSNQSEAYIKNVIVKLKTLSRQADATIDMLFDLAEGIHSDANEDELKSWLSDKLMQQFRVICDALEKLDRRVALNDFKEGFARYEDLTRVHYDSMIGSFYSPAQALLSSYTEILELNVANGDESSVQTSLRILENLLNGTATILEDAQITPTCESDINRLMKPVIQAAFPGSIPSAPIATVMKTYKPELGVTSLGALVEYKFADNKEDMKQCVDGVFADSRGYTGDGKWNTFFAVFFQTGAYYNQADLDAQFKQCGVEAWKVILVTGRAAKKKKTTPQTTPAAAGTTN